MVVVRREGVVSTNADAEQAATILLHSFQSSDWVVGGSVDCMKLESDIFYPLEALVI